MYNRLWNRWIYSTNYNTGLVQAGYNNKIVVHGETSGRNNEQTVFVLLSDTSAYVKTAMRSVINRIDSSGNSALHYAKHYPNQVQPDKTNFYVGNIFSIFRKLSN